MTAALYVLAALGLALLICAVLLILAVRAIGVRADAMPSVRMGGGEANLVTDIRQFRERASRKS